MKEPTSVGVTISKEYRKLNTRLHEKAPHYGTSAQLYGVQVRSLVNEFKSHNVLDYGCGKGVLQLALGLPTKKFDPCVLEYSKPPAPADIVACIEVLEHIEPEYLDAVLDDLRRLTRKVLFATVATGPSSKVLQDGRNAHLIQEPEEWWLERIGLRFTVRTIDRHQFGFLLTATPRG